MTKVLSTAKKIQQEAHEMARNIVNNKAVDAKEYGILYKRCHAFVKSKHWVCGVDSTVQEVVQYGEALIELFDLESVGESRRTTSRKAHLMGIVQKIESKYKR